MRFLVLALLTPFIACYTAVCPPTGAVYERTIRLPVIGRQCVHLEIASNTLARLTLSGRLNLQEEVKYCVDEAGRLSFELSAATQRILRRFRTSMVEAGYSRDTDKAYVVVAPPLPLKVRISLNRLRR